MSDEQTNTRLSKPSTDQSENGAQVLPFRRRLKSLSPTLHRAQARRFSQTRHSKVNANPRGSSKKIQAVQALLLVAALLLTLRNCGTL